MKKVFINAPIFDIENENEERISALCSEVRKFDFEAVAPSLDFDFYQKRNSRDFHLIKLIEEMIHCDIIVTDGNWYEFQECITLNEIARLLKKEIIHSVRVNDVFSKRTKNNR